MNDLLSLQAPSFSSSLPLQYSAAPTPSTSSAGMMMTTPMGIPGSMSGFASSQFGTGVGMGSSPSAFGTGVTMGASPSHFLNPNPAFNGLASSPGGMAPFPQMMNSMSNTPNFMSSSPGMNPFHTAQFQQQQQQQQQQRQW
jgi:hypothetical protein